MSGVRERGKNERGRMREKGWSKKRGEVDRQGRERVKKG